MAYLKVFILSWHHLKVKKEDFVICSFLGNSPASEFLIADVSEFLIGSIFIGRWMKNVSNMMYRVYIPVG